MSNIVQALSSALGIIKNFDTGITSRVDDKMIIDFKGDRYVVKLTKLEEKSEDIFEDIDRYL